MDVDLLVHERQRLELSLKYTDAALEVCDDGARDDLLQWRNALVARLRTISASIGDDRGRDRGSGSGSGGAEDTDLS